MELKEHTIDYDIEIVRLLAKRDKKMRANSILFKYKSPHKDNKIVDYRCQSFQTVIEVCVEPGMINKGTVILKCKEGCLHPVIAFGLCADCGKDLKNTDYTHPEKCVSMLHAIPQVSVSETEAKELGMSDILHQLKQKKLTLVVDLDQTLIHTSTTDIIPQGISGVFHFYLSNKKFRYSTRLRPGTENFLKEMSKLYEMHVFTMGARDYANTISSVLDPDRKYFSSRILSRDECFDNHSKVPKLQALFPKGDKLVVIIDDRFDMWTNCPNLIRVRPYNFFEDVGDINDPNGVSSRSNKHPLKRDNTVAKFKKNKPLDSKQTLFCIRTAHNNISCVKNIPTSDSKKVSYSQIFHNLKSFLLDGSFELAILHLEYLSQKLSEKSEKHKEQSDKFEEKSKNDISESNGDELNEELEKAMDTDTQNSEISEILLKSDNNENKSDKNEEKCKTIITQLLESEDRISALTEYYMKYIENGPERQEERHKLLLSSPLYQLYSGKAESDSDRYLADLEIILKKIHNEFYAAYSETKDVDKLPDTKNILPKLREVLHDCNLVFSGIIPTNYHNPYNHPIWCAALQLGAEVTMTITKTGPKKTTHLVTARADTGKVHQALKMGIKILTEEWLWACFEKWEKISTELYEWRGLTGGKRAKSKSPEPILKELNEELKTTLGDSTLEAMQNEVDEVLAGASDYSSQTDSEDSSDAESMESNDLTGPPASVGESRKRRRSETEEPLHLDPLFGNRKINEEEDDYVSDGSLEGDLIDELEAEMTEQLNDAASGEWECSS